MARGMMELRRSSSGSTNGGLESLQRVRVSHETDMKLQIINVERSSDDCMEGKDSDDRRELCQSTLHLSCPSVCKFRAFEPLYRDRVIDDPRKR